MNKKGVLTAIIIIDIVLLIIGMAYYFKIKLPRDKAEQSFRENVEGYAGEYQVYSDIFQNYFDKYQECLIATNELEAAILDLENVIDAANLHGTDIVSDAEIIIQKANDKCAKLPKQEDRIDMKEYSMGDATNQELLEMAEDANENRIKIIEERKRVNDLIDSLEVPDYSPEITELQAQKEMITNPSDEMENAISMANAKVIDPFENLEITFSGIAPFGEVAVSKRDKDGIYRDISYECDKKKNLNNGDIVVISIKDCDSDADIKELNKKFVDKYKQKISGYKKEYEVNGLSYYIKEKNQIDPGTFEKLIDAAKNKLTESVDNKTGSEVQISNCTFKDCIVLSLKENSIIKPKNKVYLVFEVDAEINISEKEYSHSFSYFYVVEYDNVSNMADGKCSIDCNEIKDANKTMEIKTGVKKNLLFEYEYRLNGYKSEEEINKYIVMEHIGEYDYVR